MNVYGVDYQWCRWYCFAEKKKKEDSDDDEQVVRIGEVLLSSIRSGCC